MSNFSHNYNVSAEPSEGSANLKKNVEKADFQQYHLQNMYSTENFVNPHDIAGVPGIVKTQMDEIENKKVIEKWIMFGVVNCV